MRGENPCTDLVSLPLCDPDPQPNKGWHTQGQSVMSQVGKVQGDLHTKVIFDLVYNIINTNMSYRHIIISKKIKDRKEDLLCLKKNIFVCTFICTFIEKNDTFIIWIMIYT